MRITIITTIFLTLLLVFTNNYSYARFQPYFASIKSSKANVRTGPNMRYPVKWIFVKKNEPVEVVSKFEQWRKIRDKSGDEGWVHTSIISGNRYVIIIGSSMQPLYKEADNNSNIIATLEPEVRAKLYNCQKKFCQIIIDKYKGWVDRSKLWGIYANEILK